MSCLTVGPPSAQTSPLSNMSKKKMACGCICGLLPSAGLFLPIGQEQPVKRRTRPHGWLRTGRHLVNIRAPRGASGNPPAQHHQGRWPLARPGWLFLPADAVAQAQPEIGEPEVYLTETIGAQGLAGG